MMKKSKRKSTNFFGINQNFSKFIPITTDLKKCFNGVFHFHNSILYIRAAGGLFHWNQGLSLFLALRFFYALSLSFFSLQNNDK